MFRYGEMPALRRAKGHSAKGLSRMIGHRAVTDKGVRSDCSSGSQPDFLLTVKVTS